MAREILFPEIENLIKGKKDSRENVPASSIFGKGKVVGVYFSAHWCPPCRGFTPKLAEWYTELKKGPLNDKFEIVFVSSDRDEKSFDDYFDSMPWLALPYSERDLKAKMSSKYKISGIPTFLIFDGETGQLTNKNGRSLVTSDPKGEEFPWREPTMTELLSSAEFVNKNGEKKTFTDFKGKPLLMYFSAHWCPPCKAFTPKLAEFYTKNSKDKFELIFVSGDRDDKQFNEYLGEMPWYAVPFDNKKLSKCLNEEFDVEGIPHLIVLDENLKVISENGRAMVEKDPEAKDFPWPPKPLNALGSDTANYINDRPCMVYFTDNSAEQIEEAKKKMGPTAEEYFAKNKGNDDSVVFMYTDGSDLDARLLEFINMKGLKCPKLALVHFSVQKKYVCEDDPIDVAKFLEDYKTGKCSAVGLKE